MQEKELIQKLKMLKEIRLDSSWKQEARGILLSQASNASGAEVNFSVFEGFAHTFKNVFSFMPRAAWGMICLIVVLASGSYSAYAAKYSKPGDAFYTAKILKERAQLAMTFNKEEKVKLDMKMASNHAKEISEVLASASYKGDEKKVGQLAQNFEQEINTVKERLSEISKIQSKNLAAGAGVSSINNNVTAIGNGDDAKVGLGGTKDSDATVHVVESGKDIKGIQVYDPNAGKTGALAAGKISTTSSVESVSGFSGVSGTSSTSTSTIPSKTIDVSDKINITLDKATESFNTKDFSGAKDMLEQVGVIIENIGSGAVKGVAEIGSSSTNSEGDSDSSGSSSEKK